MMLNIPSKQMHLKMVHNTKSVRFMFFHRISGEMCARMVRFWHRNRRSAEDFIAGDSTNRNNK